MPLYEYRCEACAHQFEHIQRFSDPPLTTCPKCAGAVRKLVSSPAIQFKGTGWYVTDYARKDKKDASETTASEAGESSEGKDAKKDGSKTTDAKAGDSKSSSDASPSKTAKPSSSSSKSSNS